MKLSIIIPAYSRHELTVKAVEESMKSFVVPDEIIVVNDGGDPCLREMLLAIPNRNTRIVYARIDQDILWNYNGAVNLGVWLSRGDYIFIQDTDHVPDRTAYGEGIKVLDTRPEISRIAYYRKCVDAKEVFTKPMEDWTALKTWGANQLVSMIRRDVYLQLKGQDERFCGQYGWMAYDWKNRYNNMLKIQTALVYYFWAVIGDGGEPKLKRGMSPINRRFYQENSHRADWQHPKGLLNFTYKYEIL